MGRKRTEPFEAECPHGYYRIIKLNGYARPCVIIEIFDQYTGLGLELIRLGVFKTNALGLVIRGGLTSGFFRSANQFDPWQHTHPRVTPASALRWKCLADELIAKRWEADLEARLRAQEPVEPYEPMECDADAFASLAPEL